MHVNFVYWISLHLKKDHFNYLGQTLHFISEKQNMELTTYTIGKLGLLRSIEPKGGGTTYKKSRNNFSNEVAVKCTPYLSRPHNRPSTDQLHRHKNNHISHLTFDTRHVTFEM